MSKTMYLVKQQASEPNAVDLYIYDDVEGDGQDWWTGETVPSDTSANTIKQQLDDAGNVQQINVFINSYGGEVKEGLGIYNLLKRNPAQKTAYIDGFACSIASVIPMACDKIIMGTNTLMMIHHASMGVFGNSDDIRKAANDLDVIDKASCSSYLTKAGDKLDEATLNQLLDAQTWLNAEQCLQYGLCDEIAGKEDPTIAAAKQRYKQSIKDQIKQHKKPPVIPEQFAKQKTNAEKLMAAFKIKNNLGGK